MGAAVGAACVWGGAIGGGGGKGGAAGGVGRFRPGANLALVLVAAVAVFPLLAPKARRWQGGPRGVRDRVAVARRLAFLQHRPLGCHRHTGASGRCGQGVVCARAGGAPRPALASVVVDRLFDVLLLLLAAAFGVTVYGGSVSAVAIPALTLLTVAGIAAVATPGVRRAAGQLLPAQLRVRVATHKWAVALRDAQLSRGEIAAAFGWSLVSFGATLARIALCFAAVGIHLAPATLVAVVGLSSLVGLLSISGIGTRDVFLIAALGRDGILPETALAASFLILFLNLTNIVPGFVAWLRDPVPLEKHPLGGGAGVLRAGGGRGFCGITTE